MNINNETHAAWHSGRIPGKPSVHARLKMEEMAERRWWIAAIPVGVLLAMGVADWRYWIVAGMLVFAVLPLVVLMGWLQALRSEGALLAVYDMEAEIGPSGDMTLRFFRRTSPSGSAHQDDDGNASPPTEDDRSDDDSVPTKSERPIDDRPAPAPMLLPHTALRDVRLWRGNAVLTYDRIDVIIPLGDDAAASMPRLLGLTGMRESHNFV